MGNSGVCMRNGATRVVVESTLTAESPPGLRAEYGFTLCVSASREIVTATVAGDVTITQGADGAIHVDILHVASGRVVDDALVFIPDDIDEVVVPKGLASMRDGIAKTVSWHITEQ